MRRRAASSSSSGRLVAPMSSTRRSARAGSMPSICTSISVLRRRMDSCSPAGVGRPAACGEVAVAGGLAGWPCGQGKARLRKQDRGRARAAAGGSGGQGWGGAGWGAAGGGRQGAAIQAAAALPAFQQGWSGMRRCRCSGPRPATRSPTSPVRRPVAHRRSCGPTAASRLRR